ncbi:IclR family transcriptional regulator [Allokutzneria oryzae]|uniref:IclR family transcriptional regulator n=1 Tax=Allokutzneria oryzae TaxID=1378989 RepID=A0ABV6A692_9PSEU
MPQEIAQTLDRGLQVLQLLGAEAGGLSATDVAARLGVHRSIAARLLATLLNRGFAARRGDGRYVLGTALVSLAGLVSADLVGAATPLLAEAAERLGLTAVLHVADGAESVALASIEPRHADFHVGIRPGSRAPLTVAASGLAILSGRPAVAGERAEVTEARRCGFAVTTGELLPGFTGIAAPVLVGGPVEASVGMIVPVSRASERSGMAREVVALAALVAAAVR